jgi:N-methylhydantoinase B
LFALIETNVRVPVKVFGDLRAQLAACHIAEAALIDLAARYGNDRLQEYMTELVDYAERMTRAALRELPDGVYDFLDHIDDDGIDVGVPIPLKVTLTKSGDTIKADWTGTAQQVKGAINNTLSYTKSASYCGIRSILPQNIPTNEGVFRAITVEAPLGTIANMVLPGACAARGLTGFRMVDCMFGALAKMLPDRVFAASDGGNTGVSIGGYYADRSPFMRSPKPNSHSRSPPTNSSRTRWVQASFAAARHSAANTSYWPRRRSCRCGPTGAISAPMGSMAAVRGSRR